ncbi:MAG: ABC transporter permease [Gemmatimonadetes bacterium]|nr:ABC transporter permease [Gemmatimonadota bacterium]
MDALLQDLKYALRTLRRSPAFTIAAVVTLTLGIGATTAIFSVVNGILLTPLPFAEPDRVVVVWEHNLRRNVDRNVVGIFNYQYWLERARSFESLTYLDWSSLTFTGDAPENVAGRSVTESFFETAGVRPALGRTFDPAEYQAGPRPLRYVTPSVVILSDNLWRRRFGADPQIIGKQVAIVGGSVLIAGVMPRGFGSLPYRDDQYFEPWPASPLDRTWQGRSGVVLGRLKEGVTVAQAHAEMVTVAAGMAKDFPDHDTNWSANVMSMTDQTVGDSRQALLVLLGAVGFVLAIACANVGNLFLVRATSRQKELAVRAALGASRWRLARQRLAESLLIAGVAGAAGALLASWTVRLLVASAPRQVPRITEITVDGRVLAVTLGLSLLIGLAFGVFGVVARTADQSASTLRNESGRTTSGRAALHLRNGLVVAQVSLALILLSGAGLMIRSLDRLISVDPGFDAQGVSTFRVELPSGTYGVFYDLARTAELARRSVFYDRLLERVRAMPGVQTAGLVDALPMGGVGSATSWSIVGRPTPAPGQFPVGDIRIADASYFTALRIPLKRGRSFSSADGPTSMPVVLINETAAKLHWRNEDPVGQRLKINMWAPDTEVEIVGVVGDVRAAALDGDVRPMIYYAATQVPPQSATLVVRGSANHATLAGAARAAVRELDRDLPVGTVATMESIVLRSVGNRRFPMTLLSGFAMVALVLAAIGLYAVLSYTVGQRTREMGVRMAMGAAPGNLVGLVLRQGMWPAVIGIGAGLVLASILVSVLRSLLFGVQPHDPVTAIGVSALLAAVALVACYLPARRAARVDPVVALRTE